MELYVRIELSCRNVDSVILVIVSGTKIVEEEKGLIG